MKALNVRDKIKQNDFLVAIEISKGSKAKFEVCEETGYLKLDRILHTSMQYPHSYGFIPHTLCPDGDAMDVFVLCSDPLVPYCIVRCYPVGVIKMLDAGESDDKIIAIPFKDPYYNSYNDICELPDHFIKEIQHFLESYKTLEGKKVEILNTYGRKEAEKLIKASIIK
ncbi:MAG: inorganic diphosphatase [Firmicutes bacterium]|nr:inorganic diphosphatase [Bacillota bacterium]